MFLKHVLVRSLGTVDSKGLALWRVEEELVYEEHTDGFDFSLSVPVGEIINFGSVPWGLRWLFPPTGLWNDATVAHDRLCELARMGLISRFIADALFRHFILACNVPRWRRIAGFYGVRLGAILTGQK